MIKKIFAILLIVIGAFLEIYYYQFRFANDGIDAWLAIIIGTALTLFLGLAVIKKTQFLVVALIIYSVLATSAGQSFSLNLFVNEQKQEDVQEKYRQEEIEDIKYRINQIDEKYKQIQEAIEKTATTLHDRGLYRTALQRAEEQQTELNNERTELQNQLSELRNQAITHIEIEKKKTNIYEFYNSLTLIPAEYLQFIFQTVLSVFIALMAPIGISILEKKQVEKPEKIDREYWKKMISRWVNISWMGKRTGKSNKILPKNIFLQFIQSKGQSFSESEYDKIYKIASDTKCIDSKDTILLKEDHAVNRIIMNFFSNFS